MEEAEALCDHVALMHLGTIRTEGSPEDLRRTVGVGATLEDVFRHYTGSALDGADEIQGGLREIRRTRSTAARVR
jgi:ABC-2 type transport system ATP-binding protein